MATRPAKRQPAPPLLDLTPEERLRCYTAEEVVEKRLLRVSARWLKESAYKREIPFSKQAGGIVFRLDHIWAISTAGDCSPDNYGRRTA